MADIEVAIALTVYGIETLLDSTALIAFMLVLQ